MRTLITVVILSLISQLTVGQKNFEGKIIYQLSEVTESKQASIEAFFKSRKIMAYLYDSSKPLTNNAMLVDLENGKFFRLDINNKTYREEDLLKNKNTLLPPINSVTDDRKIILGYTCSVHQGSDSNKSGIPKPPPDLITAWYADSLYFSFDEIYATCEMIPFFGDGKNIAMGFDLRITLGGKTTQITSVPVYITEEKIPDSIFSISSFKKYELVIKDKDHEMIAAEKAAVDSVVRLTDSTIKQNENIQNGKKKKPRKTLTKNTHNQPTKSSAIKPKQ